MNKWTDKWMNLWINKCINEWMNEWMIEWFNEWMNDYFFALVLQMYNNNVVYFFLQYLSFCGQFP